VGPDSPARNQEDPMARKSKQTKPEPVSNDDLELTLEIDPITFLPITGTAPRTTPIPEKPRRRGKKAK
jgi:hypothetical protein